MIWIRPIRSLYNSHGEMSMAIESLEQRITALETTVRELSKRPLLASVWPRVTTVEST